MAVLGRVLFSSAERVDLPDLLGIDSYAAGDWRYFLKGLIGSDRPYILSGFDIIDPQSAVGTPNCAIRVADSVVFYPLSSAGPFYFGLPEGNIHSTPLIPELRTNAINFVYLTLSTLNSSVDTRAFWDPDRNGGAGGEFTQDVNTESVIQVQVNVSTGSFPIDTVPVAIIKVGTTDIEWIKDARDLMFRLGTGGISPDPYSTYNFKSLPSAPYQRQETPIMMTSPADPNPFQGADKNISTLKEWMDVVMTKLKELGGTTYWYEDASTFSITSIFNDALATTFRSKGKYQHSSATAGLLTWTEDLTIKSVNSPVDVVIRAGSKTLQNEQVGYLDLVRNQPINSLDEAVSWLNGFDYVNTTSGIGVFANLNKGDWIKKVNDGGHLFLRVENFYSGVGLTGSPNAVPADAKSILLSGNYQGLTSVDKARYDQGVYQPTDIVVSDRSASAITTAGGNFSWLAQRSDTIENVATATAYTVSGTVSEATGVTVKVSATAHGLVSGDRITVTAPVAQAGTYTVDVVDANTFHFISSNTTTGAFTGFFAIVVTTIRADVNGSVDGFPIESANHGFESGETIGIANTVNFNGNKIISVRNDTTFQFAIGSAPAPETVGTATLARLDVRSEEGVTRVVQGETIDIGSLDSSNIQLYIGMTSLAVTHPNYFIPTGYNTFSNAADYNSDPLDDLTARVSKLTAMMADKAQDKTVKYLTDALEALNTTNGTAQELTFLPAGSSLTILQPGSYGNATVSLASLISLQANQSAYVSINRNASSAPSIIVVDHALVPVNENVFVIATRLVDGIVYLWNGDAIDGSAPIVEYDPALLRVRLHNPFITTLPTGNPVTIDDLSVQAGDLVLFSNLSSNNNRIYVANGSGTNITSWTAKRAFNGAYNPAAADTVIVQAGSAFTGQIGIFNGSAWNFNDKIRHFNGADYWEQSSVITSTLLDNSSSNVFTVLYAGSEYMIVDFSMDRGGTRETGSLYIVTDGTNVSVTTTGVGINGSCGATFTGDITGGNTLRLRYLTTSTGSNITMKYMIRRWSNAPGGPASVPSYSGSIGSSVPAAGSNGNIQFNGGGILYGNNNFNIDLVDLSVNLNGLKIAPLSSALAVIDNEPLATPLFSFDASSYPSAVIEYSFDRGVDGRRTGRLLFSVDVGGNIGWSDDYVESISTGLTLSSVLSGPNLVVKYTTTSTGNGGTFKYAIRRWN